MSLSDSEPTVHEQSKAPPWLTPWKPGQSGNPAGRPRGSRNKLGEAFIDALYEDFTANGVDAIAQARVADPTGYLRVCASLLPRELKIGRADELSEAEMDERIRSLMDVLQQVMPEVNVARAKTIEHEPTEGA